jgi:hypothetical protein
LANDKLTPMLMLALVYHGDTTAFVTLSLTEENKGAPLTGLLTSSFTYQQTNYK